MKKIFILTAIAVLLGVASAAAQQIAVVSENGETSVFTTLQSAIEGASDGSVIYLPGGSFTISDEVKITKKLTIIGIGHKSNNDNADGNTMIGGNIFFNEGSSGSAIMGCYITGNINIGTDNAAVNNVLVKYCNINAIDSYANCEYITVNQNYIRASYSCLRGYSCTLSNNILNSIHETNSSTICNNIIIGNSYHSLFQVYNSIVYNNIFISFAMNYCDNILADHNLFINQEWGDNSINLTDCTWDDVFVNYNGGAISPLSDFHFKEAYLQYSDIGIYGGTGFNDHQTAPVPYIIAKRIAEETDAAGQLKIQVRVKAGD